MKLKSKCECLRVSFDGGGMDANIILPIDYSSFFGEAKDMDSILFLTDIEFDGRKRFRTNRR